MKHFAVLISLLRDRQYFFDEVRRDYKTEKKIGSLLVASAFFLACYGAIIGASSSWLQMLSSAIKLPALYLITLTICLPTLYFFDILFGSALTFGQYALLVLISVSVISVLLFSFAPITLFFLISVHDYNFFLLLNVAIFAFTGLMGVKFFYQAMQTIDRSETAQLEPPVAAPLKLAEDSPQPPDDFLPIDDLSRSEKSLAQLAQVNRSTGLQSSNQRTRRRLLQFWLVLYALVGSQLGWTLRPFFGAPNETFQLFRNIEGNFYSQVFRSLFTLLGWN
ncbi:MAG: actin-binding WH2 domain-containing protein [Elainella sp. Prado103]|nr:actin-binding WH2 domain-containing protein [Elainella sp. Prado103]